MLMFVRQRHVVNLVASDAEHPATLAGEGSSYALLSLAIKAKKGLIFPRHLRRVTGECGPPRTRGRYVFLRFGTSAQISTDARQHFGPRFFACDADHAFRPGLLRHGERRADGRHRGGGGGSQGRPHRSAKGIHVSHHLRQRGRYLFRSIPPGVYTVSAEAKGFEKALNPSRWTSTRTPRRI